MPIQQEPVHDSPNDVLLLCILIPQTLKFSDPLTPEFFVNWDLRLHIEVVVAAVVRRNHSCPLHFLQKVDHSLPRYCPGWPVPVLDIVDGMDRHELLGLQQTVGDR